jgi:hypothetical protein
MQALNALAAALELPPAVLAEELPPDELDLLPHAARTSPAAATTVTILIPRDTCKTHLPLSDMSLSEPTSEPDGFLIGTT